MSKQDRPRWKFQRDELAAGPCTSAPEEIDPNRLLRLEQRTIRDARTATFPPPRRPRRPIPTPRNLAIAELLKRPAVFGDRFLESIGLALRIDGLSAAEWTEMLEGLRLVPDAFKIDPQALTVTVYEVECSHPVDDDKLRRYVDLFWLIDEYEWRLLLVRVDKYGGESMPIDMFARALEMAAMDAGRPLPTVEERRALASEYGIACP